MSLGLGSNLSKSGLVTPGIVTDSLVLKHKYDAASVVPVSDGAAYFVRTNTDSISLGVGNALTPMSTGFSACFWAKTNRLDVDQMALAGNNGTNQRMYIGIEDGHYAFGIGNSSWGAETTNASTDWTHVALTYTTGDVAQLYLNGIKDREDSNNDADGFNDGTFGSDFSVGRQGTDTAFSWDGYVCNVGIWTAALTQAQVKSIMNKNYAGLTSSEKTNLVSWWNLDTTLGGSGGTSVVVNSHDNTLGEELITSFVNGSTYAFDTLTTSGRNISAAVETSGDWAGAASNSLNLVEGEIYKCTFNLTYNSGTDTVRVLLANSANGAATSVVDEIYYTNTNGVNEAYFRVKTTDSTSHLQIGTWHSSDVINFNMTDISLKRLGGTTGKLT